MMEQPNILWICTDQQRYDTIGCLDSIGKLDEVVDQTNRDDELRQGTRIRENIPFELHQTT